MKSVVITGSTSGIGLGLADSFLSLGCRVTVSGRFHVNLEKAIEQLANKHSRDRIFTHACDVTQYDMVQALWDAAIARFGEIDIWINNAGIAHPETDIGDYTPEQIQEVIAANITGVFYGSAVSLKGMRKQGSGSIYNMEGLGSSGTIIRGMALYGTTKSAVTYLTRSLAKEVRGTYIIIGGLRPGMVATGLITRQYDGYPEEWQRAKRIFNILSDRVETVTPWMAKKILSNKKNGVTISWLTRSKVFARFIMAPFHTRTIFE
jgi:NAD(P)-dependent dehydrogenase (short-subunit alcohol dehydrogenase family)